MKITPYCLSIEKSISIHKAYLSLINILYFSREQIQCLKSPRANKITRVTFIGDSRMRYVKKKLASELKQNLDEGDFVIEHFLSTHLEQKTFEVSAFTC